MSQTQPASSSSDASKSTPDLVHLLERLNYDLEYYSQAFESLKPSIREDLHNDEKLPEKEAMIKAARSVDLLHKIQLQLDSPVLVLADHFLGELENVPLTVSEESITYTSGLQDTFGRSVYQGQCSGRYQTL